MNTFIVLFKSGNQVVYNYNKIVLFDETTVTKIIKDTLYLNARMVVSVNNLDTKA